MSAAVTFVNAESTDPEARIALLKNATVSPNKQ
jgi:hypothetical protein